MVANVIIMVSGNGSNMEAIIKNSKEANVVGVISDNPEAPAIIKALKATIPYVFVIDKHVHKQTAPSHDPNGYFNRRLFDLVKVIYEAYHNKIDYIVLAGFMTILTDEFLRLMDLRGIKVINIHPSLLPKYPGLNTHQRVIDNGDENHGFTIHHVTAELDAGPIIFQHHFSVFREDVVETLKASCLATENRIYPIVLDKLIRGELK